MVWISSEVDRTLAEWFPSWRVATNGIAQESILAPGMFNIFINDLDGGQAHPQQLQWIPNWEE